MRREPALDFVRVRDVGLSDRADPEVLEDAVREGLIVVSHDVNTMTSSAFVLLNAGQAMAGLLLAHQTNPIASVIESLVLIWSASEAEEWHGQIRFLPL